MPNEGEVMTNSEFDYNFAGRVFKIKKANLTLVVDWQRKSSAILETKDAAADLLICAYALYLSLRIVDPTITEQWIQDNTPGDIDVTETLIQLGFTSQKKVGILNAVMNSLATKKS